MILGYTADYQPVYRHPTGSHSHRPDLDAEVISRIIARDLPFIRQTIDLRQIIGVDHLVETESNSIIYYGTRRGNPAKFVLNKEAQPTSLVTVVICRNHDEADPLYGKLCLVTLFEGKAGECGPKDKNIKTQEERERCAAFWAHHALVPTQGELDQIRKELPLRIYEALSTSIQVNRYKNRSKALKINKDLKRLFDAYKQIM